MMTIGSCFYALISSSTYLTHTLCRSIDDGAYAMWPHWHNWYKLVGCLSLPYRGKSFGVHFSDQSCSIGLLARAKYRKKVRAASGASKNPGRMVLGQHHSPCVHICAPGIYSVHKLRARAKCTAWHINALLPVPVAPSIINPHRPFVKSRRASFLFSQKDNLSM